MKILSIKVMRGPNIWSVNRKKLIVMQLDLGTNENFPTNKIKGFEEALTKLMPSLQSHRCSEGVEGGFFQRVHEGTWLGHVIEHIALELQTLAGMDCGFGRTRSTKEKGVYNVVFVYVVEKAGIYAAEAAVRLVEKLVAGEEYDLTEDLAELQKINRRGQLGPTTMSLVKEAEKRNIPFKRLDNNSLLMFGQGCHQKTICSSVASTTSSMAVSLASDKDKTRRLLDKAFIPVPKGVVIYKAEELEEVINEIKFPLVAKPIDGNHGRGITTRINSYEQALTAFNFAQTVSEDVIIEKFVQGTDYRFLLIDFKLIAVAKRTPAMVMGNDFSTIQQLIDEVNLDPARGDGHENILTKIKIDQNTNEILAEKKLTLDSVLPLGEILFLKDTANISSGGTATDVTDLVHPENIFMAERIARLMNLDICGIDVISKDIKIPLTENEGAVLEVNAGPGFRMHLSPSKGMGRNVAEPVINMLFPKNSPSRIPIVAVTGTNGKTTTTRLIAHFANNAGHNVGFTTTDGIYINNNLICHGDCSGPESASVVLQDPIVDFAVLECARGGIVRSGLGFDNCNIAIVTNVSEDHLGIGDQHTLEDLAQVKAVVPQSVFADGYAILNADDDLVYEMRKDLECKIALFSMNAENPRIKEHCNNGGLAAVVEKNYFVICKGEWKTRIMKVTEVPLTFSGKAEFMTKNVLPAILTAVISNFSPSQITRALKNFIPSPELTPGRMNLFAFKQFKVMVDYVHNGGGYCEMEKYMKKIKASVKVGVICGTGDRRDQDIEHVGACAAKIFDEIIIKHDRDNRDRNCEQLTELLTNGIKKTNPEIPVKVISNEAEAIQFAIGNAKKDSLIFITADDIKNTIALVKQLQKSEIKELSPNKVA